MDVDSGASCDVLWSGAAGAGAGGGAPLAMQASTPMPAGNVHIPAPANTPASNHTSHASPTQQFHADPGADPGAAAVRFGPGLGCWRPAVPTAAATTTAAAAGHVSDFVPLPPSPSPHQQGHGQQHAPYPSHGHHQPPPYVAHVGLRGGSFGVHGGHTIYVGPASDVCNSYAGSGSASDVYDAAHYSSLYCSTAAPAAGHFAPSLAMPLLPTVPGTSWQQSQPPAGTAYSFGPAWPSQFTTIAGGPGPSAVSGPPPPPGPTGPAPHTHGYPFNRHHAYAPAHTYHHA